MRLVSAPLLGGRRLAAGSRLRGSWARSGRPLHARRSPSCAAAPRPGQPEPARAVPIPVPQRGLSPACGPARLTPGRRERELADLFPSPLQPQDLILAPSALEYSGHPCQMKSESARLPILILLSAECLGYRQRETHI